MRHVFNDCIAALGLFLTFKLFDHGRSRQMWFLQVLAVGTFFAVCALIPFMNDARHLTKNVQAATIPICIIAYDLQGFFWGLLTYRVARSIKEGSGAERTVFLCSLWCISLSMRLFFPNSTGARRA